MDKNFDICISGSGIVARTLALHLARKQLSVALVVPESINAKAQSAEPDVRAYALNSASRELLETVKCWPDEFHATPVTQMIVRGDDGGVVDFSARQQGVQALNWIVDVPALESLLADAVRFQAHIDVVHAKVKATLQVVCEGRSSQTREELGVEFDVAPYGQHALATRVRSALPHQQTAHQWFSEGEILGFLPLEGSEGNLSAIVWSVSPERATELSKASPEDFCDQLKAASHNTLGELHLDAPRKIWALQHALARQWAGTSASGTWVLAGDAAHNVHPLAGQGLNLGLGDVAELVSVLTGRPYWRNLNDPKLMRAYERARKTEFARIGGSGDALQRLFAHGAPLMQTLRNLGMNGFEKSGPLKSWITRRAMGI